MPREYDKDVKAKAIRLDRDHALTRPQVSCDPGDLVAAVETARFVFLEAGRPSYSPEWIP